MQDHILLLLENQARILAKLKNIEKRMDAEIIQRTPPDKVNALLDQFEANDQNESKDFEEIKNELITKFTNQSSSKK